jgi:histidinol dehydrogenase
VPETEAGVALANAIAPEHLEILTEDAELLAGRVTTAGCVFVGERSATAFGDYAAGSNHVLPTGGAGRFQGPLGPGVFRRRISTVEITQDAARELAPAVATLARAEGFPLHADSVEARTED